MGKFRQFLTELSARDTSDFSFPNNSLSKFQWIFTKLGRCIDIVQIWFGIANGQIMQIFDRVSDTSIFLFSGENLSTYQWIFTKLSMCIDIVEIWFRIANEQISLFLIELSPHDKIKVLLFQAFISNKNSIEFFLIFPRKHVVGTY